MQQSFQYFGRTRPGQLQQPEAMEALQHSGELPPFLDDTSLLQVADALFVTMNSAAVMIHIPKGTPTIQLLKSSHLLLQSRACFVTTPLHAAPQGLSDCTGSPVSVNTFLL